MAQLNNLILKATMFLSVKAFFQDGLRLLEKYTLIITEKPDAANRIAAALDFEGKPKKTIENGVPYYLAKREEELIIVPALGHLYTVANRQKGKKDYPVFDYQWIPRYLAERGASRIRKWLETIKKLAQNAGKFVDACDYDVEGSIIGYSILKYACDNKENIAQRMKFSTLTEDELERAYTALLPHLDFAQIEAGLTRHEVDWLYGINLSRALTTAARKCNGKYLTLSTGRVQGPTLQFLERRENNIKCFVPTPYWNLKAKVEIGNHFYEADYEKRALESKKEAEELVDICSGKKGKIEKVEKRSFQRTPPVPFDLGSLQSEAYRLFKYSPIRTLSIAQQLYLDALISYPRTSSQKLPSAISYQSILKRLNRVQKYAKLAEELLAEGTLKPTEGKREDPAHPAIYPTGKLPERSLSNSERRIWDLIVRRFMAVFDKPAILRSVKINIDVGGNRFQLKMIQTIEKGWLQFYYPEAKSENLALPATRKGEEVVVRSITIEEEFTKPPPRFNPSSLLRRMEKEEIGTKATRAGIIQTLHSRKYIHKERIEVTDLGCEVVNVLRKYCPVVLSLDLTRKLEKRMNNIRRRKETRENVIRDTVKTLQQVITELKENEQVIGASLKSALLKANLDEKIVGTCPVCKSGKLLILRSRKTGKRFIGCTNYFEGNCSTSFPLPQTGTVRPTNIACKSCSWPTVKIWKKQRRPWTLCFNLQCNSKRKQWKKL